MINNKPLCITFAGVPGCGKTPVAYHLSWNLNLPILNNDAIRSEIRQETFPNEFNNEVFLKRRNERLAKILKSKISFIYDASVDRSWEELKKELEEHGYRWLIISFNLKKEFLSRYVGAKGYSGTMEEVERWFLEHENFIARYSGEVGFVITNNNYLSRLHQSLTAARQFINASDT